MNDDSYLDDIPAELPAHLSTTEQRRFAPWHRVHKQIIREQQWNSAIRRLVQADLRRHFRKMELVPLEALPSGVSDEGLDEQGNASVSLPLKCLVIPGDDLLDMRSLHAALANENCHIKFLGFNTGKGNGTSEIRESEVRALPRIRKDSQVLSDAFQSIARRNSQAYVQMDRNGPYEVVNLDLCDVLVPNTDENATTRYYTALLELLRFQFKEQTNPWLLFITTHVDPAIHDQSAMDKLATPLRSNCDKHPEFASAMEQIVPRGAFTGDKQFDLSALTPEQLIQSFGVVLGKWMMNLCEESQPQWSIFLQSSYRYTVRADKNAAMLSLGFYFKRRIVAPADTTGFAQPIAENAQSPLLSEIELAMQMTEAARAIKDPDEILNADPDIRDRVIQASADLLAEAGYPRDAYLQWVKDGERAA